MLTYVCGDIHGKYDMLEKALDYIKSQTPGTLIFLGDYVDRGPDSNKVLETIIQGISGWKIIALKGNHEDMMYRATIDRNKDYETVWLTNGGIKTLNSYSKNGSIDRPTMDKHLNFIQNMPLYYMDNHRFYVHAVVFPGPLHLQQDSMLWGRFGSANKGWVELNGKIYHIVHGHTPHEKPELFDGRTNLDTGCGYDGGKLTIGIFDDNKPGGPVEVKSFQ